GALSLPPARARMPSGRQWTLVATIVGSSLTFVDATVVNVALPALQAELHATITDVQWVIEAYALFLGGLILVGGSMGDQFGRKRTFLAGVMLFTIASIACGLAGSMRALIVARAAQGVGAAFLVPGNLADRLDRRRPGRRRAWWCRLRPPRVAAPRCEPSARVRDDGLRCGIARRSRGLRTSSRCTDACDRLVPVATVHAGQSPDVV